MSDEEIDLLSMWLTAAAEAAMGRSAAAVRQISRSDTKWRRDQMLQLANAHEAAARIYYRRRDELPGGE